MSQYWKRRRFRSLQCDGGYDRKEVKITDAVTFLPLAHNAKEWKEYILELGSVGRTEVQNAIIKEQFQCAGYDIMTSWKTVIGIL